MMTALFPVADTSPVIAGAAVIAALFLAAALGLAAWRIIKGPSLPDRVVGLDLIALLALCVTGLLALTSDAPAKLDAALALALVAFLGTIALGRYAETRPQDSRGDSEKDVP